MASDTSKRGLALLVLAALALLLLVILRSQGEGPRETGTVPLAPEQQSKPGAEVTGPALEDQREALPSRESTPTSPDLEVLEGMGYREAASSVFIGVLRGRTIDAEGYPLPGVKVSFTHARGYPRNTQLNPRRKAVSDENGNFVIEDFPSYLASSQVRAEHQDHMLLHFERPERAADGDWQPIDLILGPAARLEIAVLDASGEPVAGELVDVALVDTRPTNPRAEGLAWEMPWTKYSTHTDLQGIASLRVPAERPLSVQVEEAGWERPRERCVGGRLSDDGSGEPIVLARGSLRRLELRLGVTLRLVGRVIDSAHRPVAKAHIRVLDGLPEESGWGDRREELTTDAQGHFSLSLLSMDPADVLTVIAADNRWITLGGKGIQEATRREIRVREWLAAPEPIELVLEPMLSIAGRVIEQDGSAVSAAVWVVPEGAAYILQKGRLGFLSITLARGEAGTFLLSGVPPGRHDLIVKRNSPRCYYRFPGIEAGADNLELILPDDRSVEISLAVQGAAPGSRMQPILLRHQPRQPQSFGTQLGGNQKIVQSCDTRFWFTGSLSRPRVGQRNEEHVAGRTIVQVDKRVDAGIYRFEPQQPGCYSVGLLSWNAEGVPYSRLLSKPFWFDDGAVAFEMCLEPAIALVGTYHAGGSSSPDGGLFVEVRDEHGELVRGPLPIESDGSFRVEDVPPGALEVRLGSTTELDAGRCRKSARVVARRGSLVELYFD